MFYYKSRKKNVAKKNIEDKKFLDEQKRKDRQKQIAPEVRRNIDMNNEEREVYLAKNEKPKHDPKKFDSYDKEKPGKITWDNKVKEMEKKVDERGHFLDRRITYFIKK